MAELYNSGTLPFGKDTLTINAVTYIADAISPKDPTAMYERNDASGAPNGLVVTDARKTGSATLQLATASTVYPEKGMTFVAQLFKAAVNVTYVITGVSPERGEQIHTVSIDFVESA